MGGVYFFLGLSYSYSSLFMMLTDLSMLVLTKPPFVPGVFREVGKYMHSWYIRVFKYELFYFIPLF